MFSHTLKESQATWPETTIYRDIESGIAELKAQDGSHLITYGGAAFAQELTRLGLVDEYHLIVHPVTFGSGYRLFGGPMALALQEGTPLHQRLGRPHLHARVACGKDVPPRRRRA